MGRGFLGGVLWGVVFVGAVLIALSEFFAPVGPADKDVAPAEQAEVGTDAAAKAASDQAAAEKAAADQAAADQAAADKIAADKAAADRVAANKVAAEKAAADKAAADKIAADKVAAEKVAAEKAAADRVAAEKAAADKAAADRAVVDTAARHKAATEEAAVAAEPEPQPEPPKTSDETPAVPVVGDPLPSPDAPASADTAPTLSGLDQALSLLADEPAPAALDPVASEPEGPRDALAQPGQPAGQHEPQRLPQIAPASDPDVAALTPGAVAEPAPDTQPKASPASTLRDNQPTLPEVEPLADRLPTTVLDKAIPGVRTSDLPQVEAEAPADEGGAAQAGLAALQRFARPFTPEGKPLFVILLHDVGAAGMAREDLARLPFPVSFVVDPLATDAPAAAALYREAGQEVLTLANGIPPGAEAGDLERTFATLSGILPESVAVIDQDLGGFQDSRALAAMVLPIVDGEGRGVVTYDRGLNAADQIAQRDGIPHAVIFRQLDSEGESKQTIRRYLDRAAFKAVQEGAVVVIGDTRAETVAAILEWTVEGRAATVTLAPVTAVLGR